MTEPSVLVLCGRSARHIYLANRLCAATNVVGIVHEAGSQWSKKKVLKLLRPDNFLRKVWRWLRDRRRYAGNPESAFYFADKLAMLNRPDLVTLVPHINHEDVIALTDRLQPDIIAVFGTALLRGQLLTKGKLGILNLHGGLSPEYRGADCTFWALYNGEPEKIGCTLHFIDAGIDTGKLIAHVCPEVREGDDELTLFWRAVQDSAEVCVEAIRKLGRLEKLGVAQGSKGKLYQVKDRGLRHERRLAVMLRNGLLRGVNLPRRVTWFQQ